MGFLKHVGWKVVQAGSAVLSGGHFNTCPVCQGESYDPTTKEVGIAADFVHRKRCPMCLGNNLVPFVEFELAKHGRHPRQDAIERALVASEERNVAEWEGMLAKYANWVDEEKTVERGGLRYVINQEAPLSGRVVGKYDNGQKRSDGIYKNGKKDGRNRIWYDNGQKKSEQTYMEGEGDGTWNEWYRNGQMKQKTTYKGGEKDGTEIVWQEDGQKTHEALFKSGKLITRQSWDENDNS